MIVNNDGSSSSDTDNINSSSTVCVDNGDEYLLGTTSPPLTSNSSGIPDASVQEETTASTTINDVEGMHNDEPETRPDRNSGARQESVNLLHFEEINECDKNKEIVVTASTVSAQQQSSSLSLPSPSPLIDLLGTQQYNSNDGIEISNKRDSFAPVDCPPLQQQQPIMSDMIVGGKTPTAAAKTAAISPPVLRIPIQQEQQNDNNDDNFAVLTQPTSQPEQAAVGQVLSDTLSDISTTTTAITDTIIQQMNEDLTSTTAAFEIERDTTEGTKSSVHKPVVDNSTLSDINNDAVINERETNQRDDDDDDHNNDSRCDVSNFSAVSSSSLQSDVPVATAEGQNNISTAAAEEEGSSSKDDNNNNNDTTNGGIKNEEENHRIVCDTEERSSSKTSTTPKETIEATVEDDPNKLVSRHEQCKEEMPSDNNNSQPKAVLIMEKEKENTGNNCDGVEKKQVEISKVLELIPVSASETRLETSGIGRNSEEMTSVSLLDDDVNNSEDTKQNIDKRSIFISNGDTNEIYPNKDPENKPVPVASSRNEANKEMNQEITVKADSSSLATATTTTSAVSNKSITSGRTVPLPVTRRFANFKNLAAGVAGHVQSVQVPQRFQNVQVPQRFQNVQVSKKFQNVQVPQRFANVGKSLFGGNNSKADDGESPQRHVHTMPTKAIDLVKMKRNSANRSSKIVSTTVLESKPSSSADNNNNTTRTSKSSIDTPNNDTVSARISNADASVGTEEEGLMSKIQNAPTVATVIASKADEKDVTNHSDKKVVVEIKLASNNSEVASLPQTQQQEQQQSVAITIPNSIVEEISASEIGIPVKESNNFEHSASNIDGDSNGNNLANTGKKKHESALEALHKNDRSTEKVCSELKLQQGTMSVVVSDSISTPPDKSPSLLIKDVISPCDSETNDSRVSTAAKKSPLLQKEVTPIKDRSDQVEVLRKELHAAHTLIMQLQHHENVEEERPGDAVMVELQANLQKEMHRRAEAEEKGRIAMTHSQTIGEEYKAFKIASKVNLDDLLVKMELLVNGKNNIEKELFQIRKERDAQARTEMALTTRLNTAKKKEAAKTNAAEHYEGQVDQLELYVKDYKAQVELLTGERDQLKEELHEWKTYAEKRTKHLENSLNDEKKLNNERKMKMKVFVQAKMEEVRSAKTDYSSLQTELDHNAHSLKELNHRYKQLHSQYIQSQTRNRELQRDKIKIKKDSEKMLKVGDSLESRLLLSAQQSEDHKNKRIHARNELMNVLATLEAERAVNSGLQESLKMTFTPKALSQQQTIQETLDEFESALQKLSTRLGRPLAPYTNNDSMMADNSNSVHNSQSFNDSTNERGDSDEENGCTNSSGIVSLSEINTKHAIQNLENETQRVSQKILDFSTSVERMHGLLDSAGTRNCIDALSSMLLMSGDGGGRTLHDSGNGNSATRRGSTLGGQRYGQVTGSLT